MIMKPEISIITVGMNHLSYVKEMLASLYSVGSPSVSFEVILLIIVLLTEPPIISGTIILP